MKKDYHYTLKLVKRICDMSNEANSYINNISLNERFALYNNWYRIPKEWYTDIDRIGIFNKEKGLLLIFKWFRDREYLNQIIEDGSYSSIENMTRVRICELCADKNSVINKYSWEDYK